MSRWEDVYDAQADLFASLGDPDGLARMQVHGLVRSVAEKTGTYDASEVGLMPDRLAAMLFNADPVYVDPDMQTVWEGAASGFVAEPLVPEDLITPAGFIMLPRPVRVPDVHGKIVSYRAILWHPQRFDVRVKDDGTAGPEDVRLARSGVWPDRQHLPDPGRDRSLDGIMVTLWHHTRDLDEIDPEIDRALPPALILGHILPWTYRARWDTVDDVRSVVRPIQALWRLMLQTVADVSHERPGGQFRKRYVRAGLPEKRVVVVRLRRPRRPDRDDHESRVVNWTHRWLVGGHWRNQPYRSLGITRQIWISPYVKGPDDKPLAPTKTRVWELVR